MWYYATFNDLEEAKASAKEDKELGYKVEIERLEGLGGTTYKVWTWIDESLKESKELKEYNLPKDAKPYKVCKGTEYYIATFDDADRAMMGNKATHTIVTKKVGGDFDLGSASGLDFDSKEKAKKWIDDACSLKEDVSKELEDKLAQIYNEGDIYFDYADNDGEMFIILDGWDDVHKLQKALKPEFEPNNEYDTSVLDELFNDEWGFSDEYSKCDHCGKLIRTAPNSYSWVPDFFVDNENGEIICGDCVREDPRAYLETLYNNPEVANTILSTSDLEAQGFERIGETYENGWYDRNDSPEEILDKALEEHPNGVFVFSITTQGQFATQFELWGAQLDMDERLKESNGGDVFNEMVNFIENELNHLAIKDKDSKNRILTCYWDNTLSDFYLKEMNGKIIFVEDLEDEDGNPIDWNRLMSDEEYLKDNFANVSTFEEFKEGIKEEDSENSEAYEEGYKEDDLIDLGEDEVPMTFGEVLEMFRNRLSREGSLIENLDEVARKCALDYIKEHDGRKIEREATR